MTFRLKDSIHKTLADSVFNELFSGRSSYYYYIGKVISWPSESSPPTPDETGAIEDDTRNRIINLKKINTTDVSLVIPRKNWSSNRIYDQFDPDYNSTNPSSTGATTLKTSDFYVMSSSFQVYKCISNNNGGLSTIEPSGNDLGVRTLGDGYKWKFMYTIPISLRSRFLTDDFMPVTKSVLESFYNDGQIETVTVDSKGSGYTGAPAINLQANVHFTDAASNTSANVPNVEAIINESSGSFDEVLITFPGLNIAGGNIIIHDSEGTGTNLFPNVTFTAPDGTQSTIVSSTANLLPIVADGKFKQVAILDPGKNYTKNAQTTITVSGDGTGARIEPFINDAGELEDAIIAERGEGYTNAILNVLGQGTGANLSVTFSTGDLSTSQSRVELSAVAGSIENYKIIDGGSGFSNVSNISVTVTGDGSGADITPILTSESITGFTLNNAGSGYTFANVIITDSSAIPGSNANIQPIFSPPNGHGFDAPTELFADSLLFFSTISDEEIHGLTINNDFRQFGILKNVEQSGSKKLFGNALGTPTFLATFDTLDDTAGGTNPISDDVVLELKSDTTRKFVVVATKNSTKQMVLTSLNNHTLATSDILVSPSENEFTVSSVNKSPDINKFSGEMLFIDNRTAVTFSNEQLVTFRTILRL